MAAPAKSRKSVLHAIHVASDPMRARILNVLSKDGPMTNAMIGEALGVHPVTVSFHTEKLQTAGLVKASVLKPESGAPRKEFSIVPWKACLTLSQEGMTAEVSA